MEALLKSITREPWGTTIDSVVSQVPEGEAVTVVFRAVRRQEDVKPLRVSGESLRPGREYIVKVKRWMTEPSSNSGFDFIYHWNNNVPMPLRVMRGRVLKETRGMVYMDLRACPLRTDHCMKCGKPLTHPVSRLYGLGPECGGHYHINPFNTEEELQNAMHEVQQKLNDITWTGWVAKSGVEYATEVLPDGNVATRSHS